MITIQVEDKEAQEFLARLQRNLAELNGTKVLVGSNQPYAYGIHEGFTRSGRRARKAGGSFYIKKGIQAAESEIRNDIVHAIRTGADLGDALYKGGLRAQRYAQDIVPVKSGNLRRSIHTVRQ